MIGLNHLGFALSRGSSPAVSCGIPSAWKMAPRWPPRLYQLFHYLSYIDYIVRDDFFLPIAPADVSAVARSTLEFFTCLFRVVLACFSTRRCFWWHFSSLRATSLSSLSIVVLSFPGTQQSELFNRTQCHQCYDKNPLQLSLDGYLQSQNVGCCFPGQLRKIKQGGSKPITAVLFQLFVVISVLSALQPSALAIPYAG